MIYKNVYGVPDFECMEFQQKLSDYCILIPIINEGIRIHQELRRAKDSGINRLCDIVICDGGSSDGSTDQTLLKELGVNTLLIKTGFGKQGAQLRMGFWWALSRGYKGFITIDGNNKDSIEDAGLFVDKLKDGYDFIQGSRFVKGGKAINTPPSRYLAVRLIHAPVISLTAGQLFTDTTNAYRGYSKKYISHPDVKPFRDVFDSYELLAYLSVRASQLKLKTCEVPVTRAYPKGEKTPTKISFFKGNQMLMAVLLKNLFHFYNVRGL